MDRPKSRMEGTQEKVYELEDKSTEIIPSEEERKLRLNIMQSDRSQQRIVWFHLHEGIIGKSTETERK